MMLVSGVMHTIFAKSTAKNIGWTTSPFQHELGFASGSGSPASSSATC